MCGLYFLGLTSILLFVLYLLRGLLPWVDLIPDIFLHAYVGAGTTALLILIFRAVPLIVHPLLSAVIGCALLAVVWEIFEWHMWNTGTTLFGVPFAQPLDMLEDIFIGVAGGIVLVLYHLRSTARNAMT